MLALAGLSAGGVRPASAQALPPAAGPQVDLNRAPLSEIEGLPITPELARAIYEYRTFVEYFTSVFDLFKVPGMTPEVFAAIRDRVMLSPKFAVVEDLEAEERAEAVFETAQRFLSQEGVSEGLVDEYIDLLRVPRNVNDMDYFALTGIQNVSPVDAQAILKARREKAFESLQELRRTTGLSYWGFRNLRDFVRIGDASKKRWKLAGDYQVRLYNTPYTLDDEDILVDQLAATIAAPRLQDGSDLRDFDQNTLAGRLGLDQGRPAMTNKLRLRLGNQIRTGFLTHRNLGEEHISETFKWYAGVDNQKFGPVDVKRAYVGNYRLAFGSGLFMDNTDFYQARRTGTGFNVRPLGVRGDISRSDESALNGGAVELAWGRWRPTFFYSKDDKDAILNKDGSFNRYITMVPRVDNATMAEIRDMLVPADSVYFQAMRDVMQEEIFGMNHRFQLHNTTWLGLSAMEIKYQNKLYGRTDEVTSVDYFNPDPLTVIIDPARIEPRDNDLASAYDSRKLGNYRDLVGADFSGAYGRLALSGEYSKLLTSPDSTFLKRSFNPGPEAYVASAYLQYENFNILGLYRDYDLGYDNPYNRSFSENNRYDQTLVGDEFRLWNPLFSFLAENDPQSKAERGFYFTTRYQLNRYFTINYLEYDNYYRKNDNTQSQRITANVEYRPIFPVRLRVRHRFSERDSKAKDEVRGFYGWDTRIEARFFLSNYNRLEFLYSTTNVVFKPRPRLGSQGDADGGTTELGTRASPGQAFQAKYEHNVTPHLTATLSTEVYKGFLWNFEDNEFLAVDGTGFRNWLMIHSALSNNLSWRLKYTVDSQQPVTFLDVRNFESPLTPTPDGKNVKSSTNSFRFQLDLNF